MKRKVIQLAGKTHVLSLPSKWVKKFGISKGDELDIEERGSRLIISTEQEIKKDKIIVDIDKIGLFDKNYLSFLYQKGYDEIELRFNDPGIMEMIQQRIGDLMGYEIVEHGRNFCRIKNVSALLDSEFDTMLRRSFLVTLEMAETSVELLKKNQHMKLNDIIHLEKTNNKFTDFCKRIINKKGHRENEKTPLMYSMLRDLEEVADQYKYICRRCYANKITLSNETLSLFSKVNSYFRTLYELFYKFDKNKASRIIFEKKDLIEKLENNFMKTKSNEEKIIIHHLMSLTTAVFDMYGPCFTLNI